ncbi:MULTISPECIES: hypothetical protein [Mycolicibacterium]|jgi:hypothetical protein|uniref:Transposase n=3 Tax=Mycolicibacterium TaxID=1866885 RepID=A0AAE4VIT0_MYCFO|nr:MULTISPECIES: hypothetical protein [Mycolicibacterium]KMV15409.1 hypothetical protein ACT17_25605 [Mycolicibacterium conceptionense]KLI05013.1 hypothetical protein AA982_27135 [Mycolicibacterium senegalense]KLO53869.1 hypothetical protein ABW05_22670 [Mycolicibacterium senegalense]MDV7194259.1 hypothetical protein [Mycolicibacterium fortuitum]MDV7294322.1 hypothetical protein [Mycolicibacterium fortuitum]
MVLKYLRLRRTIRSWNNSNGVTVHHKWENCWCGAHVLAEGSEAEVQFVCEQFRARHRHISESA